MSDFGHTIAAALPQMRANAESLMVDTATVQRKTGATTDPDNKQRVPVWSTIATTPLRVIRRTLQARSTEAGGQQLDQWQLELRAPWSLDVRKGDRVTITAQASPDPLLLGVPIHVAEVESVTHPVQRRFKGVLDADRS